MILVGHAQGGQAPSVLQFGIEGKAVVFDRQRSAVTENLHGAVELPRQGGLEVLSKARRICREAAERKADGREIEARVESATSAESDFLRIEFVEIVQHSTH